MKTLKLGLVVALTLGATGSLFAAKRIYTGKLNTGNELHEVVGSNARGTVFVATNINGRGYLFQLVVSRLSGPPTAVHLHGPATSAQNGPVITTLCGGPAPSAIPVCPDLDANGVFAIQGLLAAAQPGVTGADFFAWVESDLVYANVHTALNPAGEVRGILAPM